MQLKIILALGSSFRTPLRCRNWNILGEGVLPVHIKQSVPIEGIICEVTLGRPVLIRAQSTKQRSPYVNVHLRFD
jgi:hypothetical protein